MMKETHFMDRSALFSSHLSLINLLASTLLRFFVYVLLIFTRIQSTSYIQFVWTGCYKPYLCHFKIDFQFPAIGRPPTKIHQIKTGRFDFFANHCTNNYLKILGFIVFPTFLSHFNCLIIESIVMLLHLNHYFFRMQIVKLTFNLRNIADPFHPPFHLEHYQPPMFFALSPKNIKQHVCN